jgi:acetyl esterase/lipase
MVTTRSGKPALVAPPFDAELAAALPEVRRRAVLLRSIEDLPALRHAARDEQLPLEAFQCDGQYQVDERVVPGPAGAPEISLLVCRPARSPAPVGAIYYIHGGGMVTGHNRGPDVGEALNWAAARGFALLSVEYRLAPEDPYPAGVEDCYTGLEWTVDNAESLGIDPRRVVIAGTSAGGGLAAATALLARDRGGPTLAAQMLLCPMLDDRNDTPSVHQMAGLDIWDRTANQVGWTALLGHQAGGRDVPPYAAPARAHELSGLPPTFLEVGSAETFRDEVVTFATRLWAAGGDAELHVWPGGFHSFDGLVPNATLSRQAKTLRSRWLARVLGN